MTGLSTLPNTREQARHGLLLLGVPTAPRLLVEVHTALFDGDLSVSALAALIRGEERAFAAAGVAVRFGVAAAPSPSAGTAGPDALAAEVPDARPSYFICPGLNPDLTAARGVVTLSTWPPVQRICTPATARAEALASVARIAEFVAVRPAASGTTLLRRLAEIVPGGAEALDVLNPLALAEAARAALADPALADAAAAEAHPREAAAARAARIDERSRLFGIPAVPHQRGSE